MQKKSRTIWINFSLKSRLGKAAGCAFALRSVFVKYRVGSSWYLGYCKALSPTFSKVIVFNRKPLRQRY